ncbi:MAG: NADH-quinone oxidoreductase subunit I [Deltaproteobacteria bacterium]|nr:NADH-quinone oxidoreductase subunit I [Deltaproteobacteria bacterium]
MNSFVALLRGLKITISHFVKNLLFGKKGSIVTVEYPDEKLKYGANFRGVHRLLMREDGTPRCVACYMCQAICPALCIKITATERKGHPLEKMPSEFIIDELRCVVCGLCVEACPEDAIRMDSGIHMPPYTKREDFVLNLKVLHSIKGYQERE